MLRVYSQLPESRELREKVVSVIRGPERTLLSHLGNIPGISLVRGLWRGTGSQLRVVPKGQAVWPLVSRTEQGDQRLGFSIRSRVQFPLGPYVPNQAGLSEPHL